jgi:poly(A) polymerase
LQRQNSLTCLKKLNSLAEIRNTPVYIVGGTVRDLLLGRDITDLDMVVFGDVWRLAADLARAFETSWFIVDEPNQTARVIMPDRQAPKHLDLIGSGYQNLQENLLDRDFTVNSMAIRLLDYLNFTEGRNGELIGKIIDPAQGLADLPRKILRLTRTSAFEKDALRLLRAVRLSATLGFDLASETRTLIKEQAGLLALVKSERIRDELFKILAVERAYPWILLLDELALLAQVFPELTPLKGVEQNEHHALDVWGHSLAALEEFELQPWEGLFSPERKAAVEDFLSEDLAAGRQRRQILKIAALLHDMGKPAVKGKKSGGQIIFYGHEQVGARQARLTAERLKLSNREKRILSLVIDQHMRPFHLFRAKNHTEKAEYRFFATTENETVSVLLLSLADRQAGRTVNQSEEAAEFRRFIQRLTEKYYTEFLPARKERLINGRDVMTTFGLKPGPALRKLLEQVEEAQALGRIHSRDEAIGLVGKILKKSRLL